ncbi:unnamed protein product [Rangifer tarandus platyrhynchus]|uniref:Uncharacterized protein n=2 Tax=Rangifer tarandus platyrhynchus TaxID=3082113 RepID=A0AC59Z9R0_RANTA|nr:unnamed protein product [Rangifer tarandus platyrhynchus]
MGPGATSHNPHQPANLTWVIYNPETGEVLNSSSSMAPKETWWPVLTFDLCVLAADGNGFGPHQLTKFFAHGSFGLFTRNCERKGPQYYEQVPVYARGEEGIGTKLKNVGELTLFIAPLGVAKTREVHFTPPRIPELLG